MKWKNAALAAIALIAIAAVAMMLLPQEAQAQQVQPNGTIRAVEFGRAGSFGYATLSYNGTGRAELLALAQQPKSRIIVLKADYLGTERYSYFMDALSQLSREGFQVEERAAVGFPENSIVVIPSGAMPSDVLARLDNLTAGNRVIYIGKTDLVYSQKLVQTPWKKNVSNATLSRMTIIEKTLDEFYSEKNYSLFAQIERNSWAEENSTLFSYSGNGTQTLFMPINNSQWLRLLPLPQAGGSNISDSKALPQSRVRVTGNWSVFPWDKARLTIQLNYSNGTAYYTLEKDGVVAQGDTLERVRGDEAFFLALSPPSPGDYLLRISDSQGTLGAQLVHVRNLSISLSNSYGNAYEFTILLDGAPLASAPAVIGLNHSTSTVSGSVKDGKLLVHANLRQGENVFVINLFGKDNYVPYSNTQENLIEFYATYLTPGIILIATVYVAARMRRKPVYRIRVPESVSVKNPEVRLYPSDITASMEGVERTFGWEGVPLYAREIGIGLKQLTGGKEVPEGNIEAVMKKLEEKGLVTSHLGTYGLPQWGDKKRNALKRVVRDKLVQSGTEFTELPYGFDCGSKQVVLDPEKAPREAIAVFEDQEGLNSYLSSLDERTRARLEIRVRNGALRLATLEELDGLL